MQAVWLLWGLWDGGGSPVKRAGPINNVLGREWTLVRDSGCHLGKTHDLQEKETNLSCADKSV